MKHLISTAKFASRHLLATHGHFHGRQFSTANYFFKHPILSYLAMSMATWQYWSWGHVCPWQPLRDLSPFSHKHPVQKSVLVRGSGDSSFSGIPPPSTPTVAPDICNVKWWYLSWSFPPVSSMVSKENITYRTQRSCLLQSFLDITSWVQASFVCYCVSICLLCVTSPPSHLCGVGWSNL